jgi:asparagine synthase (glutamine-hydrolysing)
MCGIFGAVGRDLPFSTLERICDVLKHRGPDGRGVFVDEDAQVTLAHTRLAVIDLASGAQPLESDDGTLVLSANGEIYDFERIRVSLEAKGHRFRTKCDSEVILYLYREYGLGCFEHLRGEFAFLLYDKAKRQLIAARDRFGIKPLYFARLPGSFIFASEMKAIFASGLVEPSIDLAAIDPLLDRTAQPRFPFERIEHVPPASFITIDLETLGSTLTHYWSLEIPDESADLHSSNEAARQSAATVREELEQAVSLRLRADVPVGLYLSGGIDSSLVGALMERNSQSQLHSFSISFVGSNRDEQAFARRAADVIGTEHHDLAVTRDMLWANLEDSLWFSELPFVTLAPVGKFLLSEEARRFVTVVLTGEGADEVFLGYRGYFHAAVSGDDQHRRRAQSAQLRRLNLGGAVGAVLAKLSLLLVHKSRRARVAAERANAAPPPAHPGKPLINALQEARIAAMPFDILCFLGDREEMGHSLEARLPFLDHRLYDAAKRIPAGLKFRDGVEKAVLRDAAKDLLPDDLRLRRKQGFMRTSDDVDFFGADRDLTCELRRSYLSKKAFSAAGLFSYRAYLVLASIARFRASKRLRSVNRTRRVANKLIMMMMQMHMLHRMFVTEPRWKTEN